MKKETFDKIKAEFPLLFTATVVSLLSSTLYNYKQINLFSKEGFDLVGNVFITALLAFGIIYGFYYVLCRLFKKSVK